MKKLPPLAGGGVVELTEFHSTPMIVRQQCPLAHNLPDACKRALRFLAAARHRHRADITPQLCDAVDDAMLALARVSELDERKKDGRID